MKSRERRRHDRWRLIQRVKRIWKTWGSTKSTSDPAWKQNPFSDDPFKAQKEADHPNECDHVYCRSPRKWAKGKQKLTVRERRHLQQDEEKE